MAMHEVEPGSHLVHFYATDDALASSVAGYLVGGQEKGEAVLLIAEPAHLGAMCAALRALGVDPDAGPEYGIHLFDASATLAMFMDGGRPVPERFADTVGNLVQSVLPVRPGVRAYGEMVELLWREGNAAGALALEELWNELARDFPVTLYCAYRDALVAGTSGSTLVDAACRLHSAVVGEGQLATRNSACRRFAAEGGAPAAARTFALGELRIRDGSVADRAALVVSELATNAVRHGGTPFSVTLSSLADCVRISVRDGRADLPMLRGFSSTETGGRGLHIVDALCRDWGISPRRDGKVVWAELDR
ncbi:MAG TPA: MEDS domain-containing protein [Acidimicrobiales bacterium]|nr:MEDS domain-containing protein [Acidimicrobiales bacterium]